MSTHNMFLSRNKKNIDTFWLVPYQELCLGKNDYFIASLLNKCHVYCKLQDALICFNPRAREKY